MGGTLQGPVFLPLDSIPVRPVGPIWRPPPTAGPIVYTQSPSLAVSPTTPPPSPTIASPLIGTATGFQFSFNQVTLPAGATNVIAAYRIYRNTLNVFSRNLVHTFTSDMTKVGVIVFTDLIVPAAGLNYYYWVTSVDTFGNESTPQPAQCGTVAGSIGSTPFGKTTPFTYTATTTSITWYWDGTNGSTTLTIYRADNTTTGPISGNQTITGLTPATTYNFYPYWDETAKTFKWVAGGSGTPAYAQPSAGSAVLVQQQNLRNQIPLSIGGMQASTPAAGTGGGSGGGGGGGGGCFTGNVKVKTTEGYKRFDELPEFFEVENHSGTHRARLVVHKDYVDHMIDMGNGWLVTVGHCFLRGEAWLPAHSFFALSFHRLGLWRGTVYNMHVDSAVPESHHYILENGLVAHNLNKD